MCYLEGQASWSNMQIDFFLIPLLTSSPVTWGHWSFTSAPDQPLVVEKPAIEMNSDLESLHEQFENQNAKLRQLELEIFGLESCCK